MTSEQPPIRTGWEADFCLRLRGFAEEAPDAFMDPADYDRFEQNDRVSIVGLYALQPGQPVKVQVKKPDGRVVETWAKHSMTREQIAWFRAGSALNAGPVVEPRTGQPARMEHVTLEARDTRAKPGKDV